MVCDADVGFSYCSGGVFWWNGTIFGKNGIGEMAGVFDICGDLVICSSVGVAKKS